MIALGVGTAQEQNFETTAVAWLSRADNPVALVVVVDATLAALAAEVGLDDVVVIKVVAEVVLTALFAA